MPESRAVQLARHFATTYRGAGEQACVAVLLSWSELVDRPEFTRHIKSGYVDFGALLRLRCWSGNQRFIIATTAALWSRQHDPVPLGDMPYALDDADFALWKAIVEARMTGRIPDQYAPHPTVHRL